VRVVGKQVLRDEKHRFFNYVLTENHYISGGPTNNGGVLFEWFATQFGDFINPFDIEFTIESLIYEASNVDAGSEGLLFQPEPVLDPTRPQARITLESVQVDAAARRGAGDSSDGLRRVLSLGTAYLAAEQVGGAERCMEMSVDYAKTRYQFGRPIGSYQSIKHRCANMLMKVENAKSAARYAARVVDHPDEMAIAAPLAGAVASEAYVWVAGENIQVHGGIGFTWEHDAHIYLKRAKTTSLLLGDSRHQRDLLGKAIGI
jgi:alkylation response protein AidB-like acyl-CoA dehydrogenase